MFVNVIIHLHIMEKYLIVTYYPDEDTAELAARFHDGNGTSGDGPSVAYFSRESFCGPFNCFNIDIGDFDNFRGTCEELRDQIIEAINDTTTSFSAIGHLFIILGECPEDYDYIIIENNMG